MKIISQSGAVSIWKIADANGADFYVYEGARLVRVCPSLGMANEVAAGLAQPD